MSICIYVNKFQLGDIQSVVLQLLYLCVCVYILIIIVIQPTEYFPTEIRLTHNLNYRNW